MDKRISKIIINVSMIVSEKIETPKEIKELIKNLKIDKGYKHNSKYIMIKVNGLKVIEHRYIWEFYKYKIPRGMLIHHINGDPIDNNLENLQLVTFNEHMKIHRRKK